ncbi:unnamed protein product [Cyclocybe aegerita]|uniref:Uncharacterized protein n=1 Tax=Cyclocybe aegerita TaxID=1973307 RepID=A0A8S0VXK4_CYCAE|nr:unnamed protein product [Cyclocybe aegerita]
MSLAVKTTLALFTSLLISGAAGISVRSAQKDSKVFPTSCYQCPLEIDGDFRFFESQRGEDFLACYYKVPSKKRLETFCSYAYVKGDGYILIVDGDGHCPLGSELIQICG